MTSVTHRQKNALITLQHRHIAYAQYTEFSSSQLGSATAAILRRLVPLGYVNVTRGGRGSRQFYSITERGVAQTIRSVDFTCFNCREVLAFESAIGDEDDIAGAQGWLNGHGEGNREYVCPNCKPAICDALPLGTEEGRNRFATAEPRAVEPQ
jgi:hypothetical protein